jgi:hypothetical protein
MRCRKVNTMLVPLRRMDWRYALGASACALFASAIATAPAWAQSDAQRRAELRSSMRQQQTAPPAATLPVSTAPVSAPPAAATYHHLSEQQRGEMRRQLARELRAQGKS